MAAKFCVDCGLPLTGRYCGACGRDYGATDAAQRASCPLATVQQDSSSTAGAQQEVAEAQQDVSSSTAGDHLPTVTSALALCAGCNTRKRARIGCWSNCRGSRASWGIYVEQEYHKLARWTNGLFSETNVCSCSK